MGDLLHRI